MNVAELLQLKATHVPNRPAIIDLTGSRKNALTYAELESASARAAGALIENGLEPGEPILVLHPMNLQLYVAVVGMLRAGAVPVFCDPASGRVTFSRACDLVQPRGVFASAGGHLYAAAIPALRQQKRFAFKELPGTIDIAGSCGSPPVVFRQGGDAAIVTFTSGSTGTPKAIVRTHALLQAQLDAICGMLPLIGRDVVTMPMVLLANLAAGATSVIPGVDLRRPGNADPQTLARDIERTEATSIVASPAMLARLKSADASRLRSLRRIVTGGGPVMPSLMFSLRDKLPDAEVFAVYGSSEAEPIACLPLESVTEDDVQAMKTGAGLLAGAPVANASIRIFDGEIVVAGDHVVPGYLHGVGDAETKIRLDGRIWHRTGDGGYEDTLGRLWLTGRVQGVIRDALGKIEPLRVECALSFDNSVAHSALTGERGRRSVFVEVSGRTRIDLRSVKRRLAWAYVDDVRVVRKLPFDRRHNAKIDYVKLRAMAGR